MTTTEEQPRKPHHQRWHVLLPIPLLMIVIAGLWVADLHTVYESHALLVVLNLVFIWLASLFICVLTAYSFLGSGHPGLLLFGCGALLWGLTSLAAAIIADSTINPSITVHNLGVFAAALCHFGGILSRKPLLRPGRWLAWGYSGMFFITALLVWIAKTGWMPVFFIDGYGGTPVRQILLIVTISLLTWTAWQLVFGNRHQATRFFLWYGLGIALLATGVSGILLQSIFSSPLSWTGRIAQYLGGVYLFIAASVTAREQGSLRLSPTAVSKTLQNAQVMAGFHRQSFLKSIGFRYGAAVAAVTVAMGLRLAIEAWIGTGLPTYITFYPAIMVVAVLAGFGPGIVATIGTSLTVDYWILLPEGLFAVSSPVDRVGLVLFTGMGVGMSALAEIYRRKKHKAAAYDREMALRESQYILQKQVELVDPVRAEIIAREMLRFLRERDVIAGSNKPAEHLWETSAVVTWGRRLAGSAALVVGGFHLALYLGGWVTHWSMVSGQTIMKTNMALGQALAGAAMLLLEPSLVGWPATTETIAARNPTGSYWRSLPLRRLAGGLGALIVLTIGILTLSEHLFDYDLGIDRLLASGVSEATDHWDRICLSGSLNLTLLGTGLMALALRKPAFVPYLGIVVWVLTFLPVIGFFYGIDQFFNLPLTGVAWPTVLGLSALGLGLILIPHKNTSTIALLLSDDLGGMLLRRLLPAALLVPVILGFVHMQGERLELLDRTTGTGALTLITALLLSSLGIRMARYIGRIDANRREIDIQLRNQAEVIDQAHEPLIVRDSKGIIRFWNRGAEELYGWTAVEAVGQNHHVLLHTEGHLAKKLDRQLEVTGCWEGELVHTTRDGRIAIVESRQNTSNIGGDRFFVLEANRDITERSRIEEEREATIELLRFCNESQSIEGLVRAATAFFRKRAGCEAVEIRLQQRTDPPCYETRGLPATFVLAESGASTTDEKGYPIRDSGGNPLFDCRCCDVLRGQFDSSKPSFNASMALIPLKVGIECLGLLQLYDRRKGRFTPASIALWDRLASYLAVTLAKLRAEEALKESEERLRTLANAIPQLCWTANPDGWISWYNRRWYEYTGTSPEQMAGWGWQSVHDPLVLPQVLESWHTSIATGGQFEMTFPLRGSDGVFRPFLTRVIPLKDDAGRVLQWFGTNTDVSEQKRIEQALRESEALYRGISESIDYGVWTCAADGRNTYASESFLKMVGITQEQCSDFGWGDVLHPDDSEQTIAAWQNCVRTGSKWDREHRFRGADGQWHHVLARGVPIRDAQGEVVKWVGINLDISRLKQAEAQVKASLAEKEVMLREIHHRVKNNLQVISSLVSLQADNLDDERIREELKDVRDRVRSMALVHETLYQTNDLARLNFGDYATNLLHSLWRSHGALAEKVRLQLAVEPVVLPIEAAVPCGLLLNELAGNALKHAFPGNSGGEITVTLKHDEVAGAISLQVGDNGIGLPVDMDWRQSRSLGLRLVQILTSQLRGTVETGSGPGTTFQVNFFLKEAET
jgi:PAS domain S-box-containing protein